MKSICIVYNNNNNLTSAIYGIGTYIQQLKKCLLSDEFYYVVVNLCVDGDEISIDRNEKYDEIFIPFKGDSIKSLDHYYSSIPFMLYDFIPNDNSEDIIFHVHSMKYISLVCSLKRMYQRSKVVLTIHYTDWSFRLLGDINKLLEIVDNNSSSNELLQKEILDIVKEERALITKSDKIICIAEHSANSIQRIHKVDNTKISVINNGLVDEFIPLPQVEKCKLKEKYYISDNTRIVLFAGRLHDIKGISHLLKAFGKALKKSGNLHLFIAGKGDFEKWITESSEFGSRVSFLGHINKNMLYEFYQMADVGIVPSIHEEFGYVAIEMMMHKIPIIVNNTTGLKEIVEDKQSGLTYNFIGTDDEKGINELAELLLYYINNPNEANRFGENGRKRFLDYYSLPVFKEKMLNLYKSL